MKYLPYDSFQAVTTDTDSIYFGISEHNIIDCVKNYERNRFISLIKNYHDVDEVIADVTFFFPRQCCPEHNKCDQRSLGLFKLENQGQSINALLVWYMVVLNYSH